MISKIDWDSYETSWDFVTNPMIQSTGWFQTKIFTGKPDIDLSQIDHDNKEMHSGLMADHYELWKKTCNNQFRLLKKNEEELNRIFIDIYGLQDELTPE